MKCIIAASLSFLFSPRRTVSDKFVRSKEETYVSGSCNFNCCIISFRVILSAVAVSAIIWIVVYIPV